MTNRTTLIQEIREKCIAANPEIADTSCPLHGKEQERYCYTCPYSRPIHLADVLLAIDGLEARKVPGNDFAYLRHARSNTGLPEKWNLRKDSLEDQSDETISFIHSVVAV